MNTHDLRRKKSSKDQLAAFMNAKKLIKMAVSPMNAAGMNNNQQNIMRTENKSDCEFSSSEPSVLSQPSDEEEVKARDYMKMQVRQSLFIKKKSRKKSIQVHSSNSDS